MKTKYFKIIVIGLLLIIISLFVAIYLYNKPFLDIKNSAPKLKVSAQEILNDFQVNESLANEKYVDHLIQIKGIMVGISYENGISIITLKGDIDFPSIICHMLPEANVKTLELKKGDQIMVKGICTGYLLDVMMVRCILTNDKIYEN